jgi:adenine-specific DNA-methyltransferase
MARKKNSDKAAARIDAVRHKDKRKNIPTEELRDFVREEEQRPQTILYPRDPDLDPQLVWKGKDEDDARPLEVPAVPVYIQEKIHPQAIIEDFRRAAEKAKGPQPEQLDFFADFNGLPEDFSDRVDFYHHEGNWSNRLILGDSLLVMTSLAEKEGLKGQVQMIYIDPPYGIKFGSNWQVSTRKRDVKDGKAEDVVRQPEQVKAFRDTWVKGIHSYLAYLRDRLVVARELLTESGSVFVQIGDENVHLVRCLLDEVFGSDNFCGIVIYQKTGGFSPSLMPLNVDFIVWYAKDRERVKYRQLFEKRTLTPDDIVFLDFIELKEASRRPISRDERLNPNLIPEAARLLSRNPLTSDGYIESLSGEYQFQGQNYRPPTNSHWKTTLEGLQHLSMAGRLIVKGNTLRFVRYLDDFPARTRTCLWTDTGTGGFVGDDKFYVVQTDSRAIARCILMTTDPGDLVLDPTCGSGTTAYVAEQWGRRWITIDTSRVALTLARTRLMAARFPYYLLADSPDGRRKEAELTGTPTPAGTGAAGGDIRRGFVYERVPHVTLKSIANNEEIDAIHAKWQEGLGATLAGLNRILKKKWQEWEVPREPGEDWPKEARTALKEWWRMRGLRQKEIDESIARRADTEILYDRPYEDKKTVRVTGPFTVESLSPHRTISVEEKRQRGEVGWAEVGLKVKVEGPDDFGRMILENLRTAGVQNTFKGERLKFDTLEPFSGQWIHGVGTYPEAGGKVCRAAVCIGPEHGTVGPELVKEAAKEAVQGVGFEVLIVCGFAFDPHVSEEARRYGKLVVLSCRMNPDLAMGDLLKKTGAGNLFMVFGEPDIVIHRVGGTGKAAAKEKGRAAGGAKAGKGATAGNGGEEIVVEVRGLDVYDPTTGEIRNSSTDDIACWFIDTNYSSEAFFVRHAYFTGADEPYEKLKRALRADIDEAAWSALYSTKSRPFPKPETGKIAIKVINHYGDEVLKVYEV